MIPVLEPEIVAEIGRIGCQRRPYEACGVVLPAGYPLAATQERWSMVQRRVVEVPNRADEPATSCSMRTADLVVELAAWVKSVPPEIVDELMPWHTHPAGNVGPSRTDLRNASEAISYLVVALTDRGPVGSWYSGRPARAVTSEAR